MAMKTKQNKTKQDQIDQEHLEKGITDSCREVGAFEQRFEGGEGISQEVM